MNALNISELLPLNFCERVECLDTVEVVELGENCPCPSLMKSTGPFIVDFAPAVKVLSSVCRMMDS